MKKIAQILFVSVVVFGTQAYAQDFKVNGELLGTEAIFQTDLGKVTFSEIPQVENTVKSDARQQLSEFAQKNPKCSILLANY